MEKLDARLGRVLIPLITPFKENGEVDYDQLGELAEMVVARRALRQFVEKIVAKNGTGTLYNAFPLEAELYMPSVRT